MKIKTGKGDVYIKLLAGMQTIDDSKTAKIRINLGKHQKLNANTN